MDNHVFQIEFDGEGCKIASFVGEEDAQCFAEWKLRQFRELHPNGEYPNGRREFAALCGDFLFIKRIEG